MPDAQALIPVQSNGFRVDHGLEDEGTGLSCWYEGILDTKVEGDLGPVAFRVYEVISDHGATPVIPPQKNAKIKKHGNSGGPPLPRDEAIRYIRQHGCNPALGRTCSSGC